MAAQRLSPMLRKFKVVKGFAGAQVQIVKSGRIAKIDLDNATDQDLEKLYKMNHPAVREDKPPPKKKEPSKK